MQSISELEEEKQGVGNAQCGRNDVQHRCVSVSNNVKWTRCVTAESVGRSVTPGYMRTVIKQAWGITRQHNQHFSVHLGLVRIFNSFFFVHLKKLFLFIFWQSLSKWSFSNQNVNKNYCIKKKLWRHSFHFIYRYLARLHCC